MLTPLQHVVLDELRGHDCDWLAKCAGESWRNGQRTYIDPRVKCPRWLRRLFNRANEQAAREEGKP